MGGKEHPFITKHGFATILIAVSISALITEKLASGEILL